MSTFSSIEMAPPIEVFKLNRDHAADTFPQKVNLGVGAYRTEEGKPWILPVVKKAETKLAEDIQAEVINHEYLPVMGVEGFSNGATRMLLGADSPAIAEGRTLGTQALSGTGALKNGAELLNRNLGRKTFYVSDPTWGNHNAIFLKSGFTEAKKYRYWNQAGRCFDFDGMLDDLKAAPEGAVIILHACAHNPTGIDPTQEQWAAIADVIADKKLFPFFDCAYQGFASGDLEKDAWAVRYFVSRGFELFCAQSFSKNFGLYNERAGNLTMVVSDAKVLAPVASQLTLIIRARYSNPPAHGARIVDKVLGDQALYDEWKGNIQTMASRIIVMRASLREKLEALGTPGKWNHITEQIGMFSFTGLSQEASEFMVKEKHVYMLKNGRISMCGLTPGNIDYVAAAINEAATKFQ